MKAMAEKALASRTAEALALIAFLAVIREGAETVLFLHALAGTSGGWNVSMIGGLVAAGALLAGLFVAMQWLALHLPLRPLFLATSALLFVMALRFIAGAVQEFQEQGLVAVHDAPFPDWIVNFGFNPNWESVAVPGVIAVAALASTLVLRLRAKAAPAPSAAE
jgi:high-affinity iron transporter